MENVQYLIIGNGRVATHFRHYFSLLKINYASWIRGTHSASDLQQKLSSSTHVLLLIKDDSIEKFYEQYLQQTKSLIIHFSGSFWTSKIYGAHPLYCFNQATYSLQEYLSIPFVIDNESMSFAELLPGLANPAFYLRAEFKKKYHALCVLAGNFSCILWQKLFNEFTEKFSLPKSIVFPYLQQQSNNLMTHTNSLTGPLSRGDQKTIDENLQALEGDAFQTIYQSFVTNESLIKILKS